MKKENKGVDGPDRQVKSYFIKDPAIETLAIQLFQEDGVYGGSWNAVSEQTRDVYRDMARGKKPFAHHSPRKKSDARVGDGYLDEKDNK